MPGYGLLLFALRIAVTGCMVGAADGESRASAGEATDRLSEFLPGKIFQGFLIESKFFPGSFHFIPFLHFLFAFK